ncbi:winged helix-turn-helix domain-containing protein [Streptomyces sp. KL116D]|uniref:winged helix-turn-helix domain-containing protein n=1 Tax=Streptomyces sp. KL116D TaxID=3045152 RepID=UPI003556F443
MTEESTENDPSTAAAPGPARRLPDHPVRIALLDLLAEAGTVTSTQAAARLGYSSGLCSFHLRRLAEHGPIEEAAHGGGRARPWRLRWDDPAPVAARRRPLHRDHCAPDAGGDRRSGAGRKGVARSPTSAAGPTGRGPVAAVTRLRP